MKQIEGWGVRPTTYPICGPTMCEESLQRLLAPMPDGVQRVSPWRQMELADDNAKPTVVSLCYETMSAERPEMHLRCALPSYDVNHKQHDDDHDSGDNDDNNDNTPNDPQ